MPAPEDVKAATEALNAVRDAWMARPGVISVEVARRWQDGVPTDEVGIRVTVEAVSAEMGAAFPDTLSGTPVDLVEGGRPVPE